MTRPLDIDAIRAEFPILSREVNGKPLIYFDNAASAQKPDAVLDAMSDQARTAYANVHRGIHTLANETTEAYEAARETIRAFINAGSVEEIIFTKGGTEAINLVANGIADEIQPGDEIVLSVMEHHSNIVPWHFLRERYGAVLKWVEVDETGALDMEALQAALSEKTRMVAVTHMSNVLGTVVDVKAICAAARAKGIATVIDGSQSAVHMPVNVADIDCDFYAITGHKLYGPSGSGALYINRRRHDETRPFKGGGDMIRDVGRDAVTYGDAPFKFEAGTPPIVQITALGTAIEYMEAIGLENIAAHEAILRDYARERFAGLNWLNIQGDAPGKGAIFSFTIEGAGHAHDISTVVDRKGVAVRAGHHCAQPLMQHLGVTATCRASFGMYNTTQEVDVLIDALETCHKLFA